MNWALKLHCRFSRLRRQIICLIRSFGKHKCGTVCQEYSVSYQRRFVLQGYLLFHGLPDSGDFAIVLLVMMFRRKQKNFYLYLLGLLFLLLTPFIMTILLGQQPKFRTQIVLPFVFGFLFQNFALELIEIGKNGGKVLLRGITAISVILIFQQINITSKMFYSEYVQYEEDVRLAVKITDRIDPVEFGRESGRTRCYYWKPLSEIESLSVWRI